MDALETAVRGSVMQDSPRHVHIRDGVLNHLGSTAASFSVYLRLAEREGALDLRPVPATRGPEECVRLRAR